MFKKIAVVGLAVGYTYVVASFSYCLGIRYVQAEFADFEDAVVAEVAQTALKDL